MSLLSDVYLHKERVKKRHFCSTNTQRECLALLGVDADSTARLTSVLETAADIEHELGVHASNDATIGIPVELLVLAVLVHVLAGVDDHLLALVRSASGNVEDVATHAAHNLTGCLFGRGAMRQGLTGGDHG
jgi:hypothetical protein